MVERLLLNTALLPLEVSSLLLSSLPPVHVTSSTAASACRLLLNTQVTAQITLDERLNLGLELDLEGNSRRNEDLAALKSRDNVKFVELGQEIAGNETAEMSFNRVFSALQGGNKEIVLLDGQISQKISEFLSLPSTFMVIELIKQENFAVKRAFYTQEEVKNWLFSCILYQFHSNLSILTTAKPNLLDDLRSELQGFSEKYADKRTGNTEELLREMKGNLQKSITEIQLTAAETRAISTDIRAVLTPVQAKLTHLIEFQREIISKITQIKSISAPLIRNLSEKIEEIENKAGKVEKMPLKLTSVGYSQDLTLFVSIQKKVPDNLIGALKLTSSGRIIHKVPVTLTQTHTYLPISDPGLFVIGKYSLCIEQQNGKTLSNSFNFDFSNSKNYQNSLISTKIDDFSGFLDTLKDERWKNRESFFYFLATMWENESESRIREFLDTCANPELRSEEEVKTESQRKGLKFS